MHIIIFIFIILINLSAKTTDVSLELSWKNQFQFAGYYVAKEKGFYKELGLNVDIIEYDLKKDISKDVATRKVDFGIGHSSLIIDKVNSYPNIMMLIAVNQSSPLVLLAKKRQDIKTIADIANKTIMMSNDQTHIASINAMLFPQSLKQNSFKVLPTSFKPIDLINGNTDLMLSYSSNEPFTLREKGVQYTIFDPKDYGYDFYSDILFTSEELIKTDPKLVDDFYKASVKGWKYAYSHIDESVNIILNRYNSQKRSKKALIFEAKTLKKLAIKKDVKFGYINPLRLKEITTTYRLLGLIKEKEKIDFNDFIYYPLSEKKFTLTSKEKAYLFNKKELKICVKQDNMPFEGFQDGEFIGIAADFLLDLQKKIDKPFKIISVNGSQDAILFLKKGKCDIIPVSMLKKNSNQSLRETSSYISVPATISINTEVESTKHKSKNISIKMIVRKNENTLYNLIEKQIETTSRSTKQSILEKWINTKEIKVFDYQLFSYMLIVTFIIALIGFVIKRRLSQLLKKRTEELDAQIEIFNENIPSSRTDIYGVILFVNEAFCNLTGFQQDELIGKKHSVFKDENTKKELYQDLWMTIKSGHTWKGELKNYKKDSTEYWINIVISPIVDKYNMVVGYSSLIEDITLKKVLNDFNKKLEAEVQIRTKELEKLSTTDKLTDMYNRAKLDDLITLNLQRYKRYKNTFSLIMIDIDFFKNINDTYGHLVGDKVLRDVSSVLKSSLRSVDDIGRWGGEEFLIVCPDTNLQGAFQLAQNICTNIQNSSFSIDSKVTISAGVSEISPTMNEDDIIQKADSALYKAKHNGRNRVIKG